jgi:hypothetical protein
MVRATDISPAILVATADFDPGAGAQYLTSAGGSNIQQHHKLLLDPTYPQYYNKVFHKVYEFRF